MTMPITSSSGPFADRTAPARPQAGAVPAPAPASCRRGPLLRAPSRDPNPMPCEAIQ